MALRGRVGSIPTSGISLPPEQASTLPITHGNSYLELIEQRSFDYLCGIVPTGPAVQEIVAAINHYKAEKGMVITNNSFTASAIELAKSNEVDLIPRDRLRELIEEYF